MDGFDYDAQLQIANERKKRAQAIRDQGIQTPQGRMVGGRYINPGLDETLIQGLRQYGAIKDLEGADTEIKDLRRQRAEGTQKALADFLRQSQGMPENKPGDGMGPVIPAQAPNMRSAYAALMESPDAGMRQMAMSGMVQIPEIEAKAADRVADRQFREQEAEARRQQRMEELKVQHEQRMEYLRQNNADRAAMAEEQRRFQAAQASESRAFRSTLVGLAGGGNKAPAGYRFKQDGTLEAIPGGPAAGKADPTQKPLTESQAKGSLYLGQMRSATAELDKLPSASPAATALAGSTYTNWAIPANAQKVAQLQNQWAESYLRAKTGAAATQGEVDLNKRTFFPVVGDSKAVIEQKARMRQQAERDMAPVAGPGAATAGGVSGMPAGFRVIR